MKLKLLKLFGWHVLFFFLFYELRIALEDQNIEELLSWLKKKGFLLNLSSVLVFFCYSLGAYVVLYFFYSKSILKVIFGILGITVLIIALRYFIEEVFYLKIFGFDNYYDNMSALKYGLRNLFYAILHLSLGAAFFFFEYSILKEKQAQRLIIENKKTELAYLRSQVNPHFLFNTLNNIYSLVYQKSDKSLPALEKLTAMLRFTLYEGEDVIPLSREITSIENFINLEEMRYDYPLDIDLKLKGNIDGYMMPPFLLLPFVENAFKHGDMKAPLEIHMDVEGNKLKFRVFNKIKIKQKDRVGGIGLDNIKKRLELIYGTNHKLEINRNESIFEVELEINN